ncbi:ABC transporter permease subunit [Limnohabitans sp.]|uniref:ABC transporter permease n=1 Tax=Limnohabitans sp. TaxID=1907725 RepID=UPI00286EE211|nr:ABC transporter permease subunit [Limnohabitans sp.]
MKPTRWGKRLSLGWMFGIYFFLYLPIATLIVYSFNDSKMVTLWGGFTFHWYSDLMQDQDIVDAFKLSLQVALISATLAVVLGTLAALTLVRYKRFRGRAMFSSMVNAPMVMPEVIVGLSLLLMLVAIQLERGMLTIIIGHTLLGMSYATVVVQSRLLEVDKSLEEAALDLGAKPVQVFRLVTLPMIAQALMSAWLLTFTISLDDVVISAFLSGPGSNTLPIVIFSRAKLGLNPTVNVVATLTVLVVGIALLIGSLWMARQERQRARDMALAWKQESPSKSA